MIINEIIGGASLETYMKKLGKPKLKVIKLWCRGILNGLEYLHKFTPPVICKYMRPDNLYLVANTGEVKIGKIGVSNEDNIPEQTRLLKSP